MVENIRPWCVILKDSADAFMVWLTAICMWVNSQSTSFLQSHAQLYSKQHLPPGLTSATQLCEASFNVNQRSALCTDNIKAYCRAASWVTFAYTQINLNSDLAYPGVTSNSSSCTSSCLGEQHEKCDPIVVTGIIWDRDALGGLSRVHYFSRDRRLTARNGLPCSLRQPTCSEVSHRSQIMTVRSPKAASPRSSSACVLQATQTYESTEPSIQGIW